MTEQSANQTNDSLSVSRVLDVAKACNEKVQIVYNDEGFFTPHLRSINHLSIGRSAIISSWLTISFELLYRLYMFVRDRIQHLWRLISPKRLNSSPIDAPHDSVIVGSLVHAGRADENAPICNMRVIFWARTWFLQWRKLAEARTDAEGNFELAYNLLSAKSWLVFKTVFEVYQTSYRYTADGQKSYHYDLFYSRKLPGRDLVGMQYNLRAIQLFLWEYRVDTSVPRVEIKDHDKDAPQYYSQGRLDAMSQQMVPIELTKLEHMETIAERTGHLTIQDIQNAYPANLTVCMEKQEPGITRSDIWFGLRMMNGMGAATFVPDTNKPGYYWTHWYGACDYQTAKNREYAYPTVRIRFRLDDDGVMMPEEIHLVGPLTITETDPWMSRKFTPADGEQWMQAKRVARVTAALSNELDDHFTGTHLTTEQFAIAAYRNLQLNPVAALLFPHLKEVVLINHSADSILIGPAKPARPRSMIRDGGLLIWLQDRIDRALNRVAFETGGYIPQATALTSTGIAARTRDLLGVQDWKGWKPMEALSEYHTFPRAQACYWELLGQYVDKFFEKNIDAIKDHWHEIVGFSSDLVQHAVPLYLSDVDLNRLDPRARELAEERLQWYQDRYHLDLSSSRETINGELKTITPIVQSQEYNETDLNNLKSACQYIIMMSTFMHSFVNEHQYDDIGEVLYNSLGLRFGNGESGVMAPESDVGIAPDLTRSTQMMWFSNLLSRTEYGFIVRNEEGDINPMLIELLKENSQTMADNGMPIENIESRTNI